MRCLEAADNEASNNVHQPSTSYTRRPRRAKVDSDNQLTCDRERRTIKPTQVWIS